MLPRFPAFCGLLAQALLLSCGPVYTEVDFEPLSQSGAANAKPQLAGAAGAAAGNGGAANVAGAAAVLGGAAGAAAIPSPAAAGASANGGGSGGEAPGSGGSAGAAPSPCAALSAWQEQAYQLGERVVSTCKLPYNGACPANETRKFECQPPTGALGLGWCRDRQPGVVNGWGEAWLMREACPAS